MFSSDLGRTVTGLLRTVLSRTTKDEELYNFTRIDSGSKSGALNSSVSASDLHPRLGQGCRAESTELRHVTNGGQGQSKAKVGDDDVCDYDSQWHDAGQSRDVDGLFDDVTVDDVKARRNRITEWQAGWNVTNAIQGMFIVSFPYTVLQGGYWSIISMVVIAYICCYTGKILVDCLYDDGDVTDHRSSGCADVITDRQRRRTRHSYVDIASAVWGRHFGSRVVYTAQLIELLMTCILYVLLCGDLMIGSFPDSPLDLISWLMLASCTLLPCAFLRSLRSVSFLSLWCTVAHFFINAIILIFCFSQAATWRWSDVQIRMDFRTFPIALGIVIFSYTSQIFLPTLEGNMVQPQKFASMMHWTHIAAAVFKAGFAYIGFLTWGVATEEVVTNNLPYPALKVIVNLFLVAKALLSYPLPYFAAVELLESAFFKGKPDTPGPSCFDLDGRLKVWALTLRIGLVMFTLLMAISIPHFAILMGLIGNITGNLLSLIWPCYFHLRIKGHRLPLYQRIFNISIIAFGLCAAVLGIYSSSHALIRAFQGYELRPFQGRMGYSPPRDQQGSPSTSAP